MPPSQQSDAKTLYLRMLGYAWRHWPMLLLSIFALAFFSATNTAFLASIKTVTDQGFVQRDASKVATLPWMLFALMSLRAVAGFTSNFGMRWVARRVVERLRLDAFSRLMALPVSFFDAHSSAVLTAKLTYDAEQMSNISTKVAVTLVRDSLTILGLLGYMLYLDWKLTLIFIVMAPLIALYLRSMVPVLRGAGKLVQHSIGNMTRVSEEALGSSRVVKIFGGGDYEYRRFAEAAGTNRRMQIRLGRISGINSMVVEIIAATALSLIVYYTMGKFSAGEFAAFIGAVLMLISPVKSLTAVNEDVQVGMSAAQSVFALIDSPPEADAGSQAIPRANGELEMRHVTLRYETAKRDALSDVNLVIRPGEKVALVGKSGGGKTSLVNLLPRFYELQQGEILIDGVNVKELRLDNLRAQFALVSQDVTLFNDTVINNIAYGTLRGASEAEIISAAEAAHAWEFIQQLPNGLQSEIGDRGVRLSGGQRQRIAIARAILKDAPILLLDEATSALDTESEKHVQAALDRLMQGRTTLIIAHRLSTIENADRILVLEHGKIVESGTHAELLARDGAYAKLYHRQFH